jgi:hypothetical protein
MEKELIRIKLVEGNRGYEETNECLFTYQCFLTYETKLRTKDDEDLD